MWRLPDIRTQNIQGWKLRLHFSDAAVLSDIKSVLRELLINELRKNAPLGFFKDFIKRVS